MYVLYKCVQAEPGRAATPYVRTLNSCCFGSYARVVFFGLDVRIVDRTSCALALSSVLLTAFISARRSPSSTRHGRASTGGAMVPLTLVFAAAARRRRDEGIVGSRNWGW